MISSNVYAKETTVLQEFLLVYHKAQLFPINSVKYSQNARFLQVEKPLLIHALRTIKHLFTQSASSDLSGRWAPFLYPKTEPKEVITLKSKKPQMRRRDCIYCLYWHSRMRGCEFGGAPCPYDETVTPEKSRSECEGCPYGRDSPCIGWCTKEVLRAHENAKLRGRGKRYGL